VFDTVAALGSYFTSALLAGAAALTLVVVSLLQSLLLFPVVPFLLWSLAACLVTAAVWYAATHVQYAIGLPGYSFLQTLHFTAPKMQFYDKHLDNAVWYARHAMSIDENRADFARVEWGSATHTGPARPDSYPDWLDQIWFAGVHADIGGSYSENESRLSDIALEWMVHAAENLPDETTADGHGIKVDHRFLHLNPDPCGPQHDPREPGYLWGRIKYKKALRTVDPDAILHPSVYARFAAARVPHFYAIEPYRPENLANHQKLKPYYDDGGSP
jgi:hypothetical protein